MAHLHPSTKRTVDVEKYGDPFDPGTFGNEEHCNSKIVTGFVLHQIEIFTESNACDKRLWEEAADAFDGWTGDVLHLATAATVAKLKAYLLQHGVMVPNVKGTRKANIIMDVLQEEEYHIWTEAEVKSYMEDYADVDKDGRVIFYSRNRNKYRPEATTVPAVPPAMTPITSAVPSAPPMSRFPSTFPSNSTFLPNPMNVPVSTLTPNPSDPRGQQLPSGSLLGTPKAPSLETRTQPEGQYNPHVQFDEPFQPRSIDPMAQIRRALTDLTKIYREEIKFEGVKYDIFDFKFRIFQDQCSKNPTKTRLECLHLLFEKLEKIQKGLPAEYHTDGAIRDRLINACRNNRDCEFCSRLPCTNIRRATLDAIVIRRHSHGIG